MKFTALLLGFLVLECASGIVWWL